MCGTVAGGWSGNRTIISAHADYMSRPPAWASGATTPIDGWTRTAVFSSSVALCRSILEHCFPLPAGPPLVWSGVHSVLKVAGCLHSSWTRASPASLALSVHVSCQMTPWAAGDEAGRATHPLVWRGSPDRACVRDALRAKRRLAPNSARAYFRAASASPPSQATSLSF